VTGDHPSTTAVADSLKRSTRRLGRAALKRLRSAIEPKPKSAFLTLLQVGFTEPRESPRTLVVSYTTVSPLLLRTPTQIGVRESGLFSVALSRGSPRVGVTHHLALWSPDLPRHTPEGTQRGRPADSSAV